jgi:N-acetylglutamate synthase-like GNAT family acetyltransferase
MTIRAFQPADTDAIVQLILNIQQNEFQVPVTLADQPDLLVIADFYQQKSGNFWVAVTAEGEVVGTIGLIDCGEQVGCIRKMFVQANYRGREHGIGQSLLTTLEQWATERGISSLYLGTVARLAAAIRFYERNGYVPVVAADLPAVFPRMAVDTHFFMKHF